MLFLLGDKKEGLRVDAKQLRRSLGRFAGSILSAQLTAASN
jgi:hypothetical protein